MGFFNSFSWEQNPGGAAATGAIQGAMDDVAGMKTGNRWLKMFNRGDFSAVGDPFAAMTGGLKRQNAASMDPFLPPEIADARRRLSDSRLDEQHGIQLQQYVSQALQNAFNQKQENRRFKYGLQSQLAQAMAQAQLGQYQGYQRPGIGGAILGAAMGGLGAASGLGWSPFGKKP